MTTHASDTKPIPSRRDPEARKAWFRTRRNGIRPRNRLWTDPRRTPGRRDRFNFQTAIDDSVVDRHCEPTGRANARPMTGSAKRSIARAVIASAAKQSISPRKERMDCFASLAMTSKHTFASSPRNAPEPLMNLPPKEGVGNAGCPLHPRPRVYLVVVERTRVTTSTPESPDVPARNGFNG